jgi:membrane protein
MSFFNRVNKKIDHIFSDDIGNWSGSLSFLTIFSIVPLVFLTLFILTQLPFADLLINDVKNLIFELLLPNKSKIATLYFEKFMSNVDTLGIVSSAYMLITSILFFRSFEKIVNTIFKIDKMHFLKSVLSFFALIFLFIFTLIIFIIAKAWLNSEVLSFLSIWMLFFMVFKIAINTKIYNILAIIVSFSTSFLWYFIKSIFIYYIIYNKTYATLYGSVSIVFFIFIWIFLSWYILLSSFRILHRLQHTSNTKQV